MKKTIAPLQASPTAILLHFLCSSFTFPSPSDVTQARHNGARCTKGFGHFLPRICMPCIFLPEFSDITVEMFT